jgi:hypothetical protein
MMSGAKNGICVGIAGGIALAWLSLLVIQGWANPRVSELNPVLKEELVFFPFVAIPFSALVGAVGGGFGGAFLAITKRVWLGMLVAICASVVACLCVCILYGHSIGDLFLTYHVLFVAGGGISAICSPYCLHLLRGRV